MKIIPGLFVLGAFSLTFPLDAHNQVKSLGDFYNGLLHPVLNINSALSLVACGLLLGQQGVNHIKKGTGVFIISVITGVLFSDSGYSNEGNIAVLLLALVSGLLVAYAAALPVTLCSLIAGLAGFLSGSLSFPEENAGMEKFLFFCGVAAGGLIVLFYTYAAAFRCKKHWQKITLRIFGSWIAASSSLILAFSLIRR